MALSLVLIPNARAVESDIDSTAPAQQQKNYTVKGVVLDAVSNAPVVGVTVLVPNTTFGTTTNADGQYQLSVPADAKQIVFSFLGYETKTVPFDSRDLNQYRVITLREGGEQIEEVQVVAFAKQKKESVLGSVTTVKPGELRAPSSNLTNSLAGRLSGVIAYQRSGEPGQDNAQFFVRGVTTFGTGKSDPLILIDNIELSSNDLARLNSDDIESFSVLKDATATALYGARGANGVILVTTKEGKEGKVKINFRYETSISQPVQNVEVSDPITFMELHNEAVRTRDPLAALPYLDSAIAVRKEGNANPYAYPMVDWMDMLFKKRTVNQRGNLNLSGGGNVARYYIALSYSRDNGMLKVDPVNNFNNNIQLNKYVVRSNINLNLTSTTELVVRVHGTFDDYQGPMNGGSTMYNYALKANPVLFPATYAPDEANKYATHILFGNYGESADYMNPYAEMLRGYKQYNNTVVLAQLELKQNLSFITEGLNFRILGNATNTSYFDVMRYYNPFYYSLAGYDKYTDTYTLNALNADTGTDYLNYSQSEGTRTISRSMYMEAALSYNRTFADKHDVSGLLVFTGRESLTGNASTLQGSLASRNLGLAGRFTYGYASRYYAEFNFGYNGSEKFNVKHRWGFFPSVGAGWIVSKENWWKNSSLGRVMPLLKLKGTYGLVGNDDIADERFFYLSEVNMNNSGKGYTFGRDFGYSRNGISISRYADDNIGWEISYKSDVGVEMNLFDKVDIQADYFWERRTNILQTRSDIPSTMGLQQTPKANIGEAQGHGFDMSIDVNHYITPDWWVTARGNFTYATSRFTIYEEPDYSATTPWLSHRDQKISQQWGLIAERLFVDEADVENSPRQQYGEYMAGDIKYKDINKDGLIDDRDKVPIGYPTTPEITYGFGISTGWKGFDLSVFFQGSARSSFFISPQAVSPFVNSLSGSVGNNAVMSFIEQSHWSEANQDVYAAWPRLSTTVIKNNGYSDSSGSMTSTWWLRDGSFLRLKSAEFGYTLPNRIANKMQLASLRVYVSGTNLLSWSKFDLWDVEMGGNGLGYPIQRVFNIGLLVSF